MIATVIVSIAKNKSKVMEISRHNPWFILMHKRPMTAKEADRHVPPSFWALYGGVGRVFQIVGLFITGSGLLGLIISILRKAI